MIIIQPFARKLRNGEENPKNYPFWNELLGMLPKGTEVIQIGEVGERRLDYVSQYLTNLPFKDLRALIDKCDTWIGIDSFFQHLAWSQGKKGIVLFSQSNPDIFGHPENINLYQDRIYFRKYQFQTWEEAEYNKDAFVKPDIVMEHLLDLLKSS